MKNREQGMMNVAMNLQPFSASSCEPALLSVDLKKCLFMKHVLFITALLFAGGLYSQSVGIGTTTPSSSSSLDMGPSAKPVVLPRMTTEQMNAVASPVQGMMLYNTTEQQIYSFQRFRTSITPLISTQRWQPLTTGPRMIAWGVYDSASGIRNGSSNFSVTWNSADKWYELGVTSHPFYRDSMMLMIQPIGNGSFDKIASIGELIVDADTRRATIKFTDASRVAAGASSLDQRWKSHFYFTLYDLRKDPYP